MSHPAAEILDALEDYLDPLTGATPIVVAEAGFAGDEDAQDLLDNIYLSLGRATAARMHRTGQLLTIDVEVAVTGKRSEALTVLNAAWTIYGHLQTDLSLASGLEAWWHEIQIPELWHPVLAHRRDVAASRLIARYSMED